MGILFISMHWIIQIENLQIPSDNLTERQLIELDQLWEELDDVKSELYDRILLYTSIYLTPTQNKRWFLYFKLGSIKDVAIAEGVSTAAVHKSLLGTRKNESSRSKIKSPLEKISGIIHADYKIQDCLARIKELRCEINEIIESYP